MRPSSDPEIRTCEHGLNRRSDSNFISLWQPIIHGETRTHTSCTRKTKRSYRLHDKTQWPRAAQPTPHTRTQQQPYNSTLAIVTITVLLFVSCVVPVVVCPVLSRISNHSRYIFSDRDHERSCDTRHDILCYTRSSTQHYTTAVLQRQASLCMSHSASRLCTVFTNSSNHDHTFRQYQTLLSYNALYDTFASDDGPRTVYQTASSCVRHLPRRLDHVVCLVCLRRWMIDSA